MAGAASDNQNLEGGADLENAKLADNSISSLTGGPRLSSSDTYEIILENQACKRLFRNSLIER